MSVEIWKMPPIEKVPEAFSAIADNRVEMSEDHALVYASDRGKSYKVTWRDGVYNSDDNGSRWQGYTGYPIIAVLMLQGRLPLDREIVREFANVDWGALNKEFKRKYDQSLALVMRGIAERGGDCARIDREINCVYQALNGLQLPRRKTARPVAKKAVAAKSDPEMAVAPEPVTLTAFPQHRIVDETALSRCLNMWKEASRVALAVSPELGELEVFCRGEGALLREEDFTPSAWQGVLASVFGESVAKVGHNIKPLMRRLLERGIAHGNWVFDTALAAYLLNPADGELALEKAALQYCNTRLSGGLGESAAVIEQLSRIMTSELEKTGMQKLYLEVELPLCEVLADMEFAGIALDRRALEAFGERLSLDADAAQQRVFELAGERFNLNSPKQLGEILFDRLGLPAGKKTKSGYSTDIEVLEKLRDKHPVVEHVIEYRQLAKLKSTYVDGLLAVVASDGRVHGSFNMMVTATGRLSSSEPNLQNIPIRTELGGEIRRMFIAGEDDSLLVDADYSQIELRILADIANDEAMREAFRQGEDIHTVTASQVFGVAPEQVTSEMRRRAKAVNFGIVYGISRFALAADIGVTRKEADTYMNNYFAKYSGVRHYMDTIVEQAKHDGFVTTLMGRRRYLPELESPIFNVRSFGERVALNTPIQGSAADVIFLAMIRVHRRLKREKLRARLILQIHDELIIEAPREEAEHVRALLVEEMENAMKLSVPLAVDVNVGRSWFEAK